MRSLKGYIMRDGDWPFLAIMAVISALLLLAVYGGYQDYEERQITEIVHVKVTSKTMIRDS